MVPASENPLRLFAGAKELKLLDQYAAGSGVAGSGASGNPDNQPPVKLFDRAVDFGWLYFLAKPMAQLLNFFLHAYRQFRHRYYDA